MNIHNENTPYKRLHKLLFYRNPMLAVSTNVKRFIHLETADPKIIRLSLGGGGGGSLKVIA